MKRIAEKRVIPAATVASVDEALGLSEAMLKGGLDIIEVTFRTPVAGAAIAKIVERFPEMLVGAGTVLTSDQLARAVDSGIRFAVAPGLNPHRVKQAKAAGVVFIPGVVTPTEIEEALELGCNLLKFFPAETMGGTKTLKALSGPYAHTGVHFVPTGGVSEKNAHDYLELPIVAAVGGSWMVGKDLVQSANWSEITRLCRDAVALGRK